MDGLFQQISGKLKSPQRNTAEAGGIEKREHWSSVRYDSGEPGG